MCGVWCPLKEQLLLWFLTKSARGFAWLPSFRFCWAGADDISLRELYPTAALFAAVHLGYSWFPVKIYRTTSAGFWLRRNCCVQIFLSMFRLLELSGFSSTETAAVGWFVSSHCPPSLYINLSQHQLVGEVVFVA